MSCVGVIQARTRSTRLPGKVLADLGGTPLIGVLLDRLRCAHGTRGGGVEWWVATSALPEDDALAAVAERHGARVYRGDPDDVMERFLAIATMRAPEWILRGTGDNPFVDAPLVQLLLRAAASGGADVDLWTQPSGSLPLGYGLQLARTAAFLESEQSLPDEERFHRAHVLSWLSAKGRVRELELPAQWPARPSWRWTVDTERDLAAVRAALATFGSKHDGYPEMVAALDRAPAIVALNRDVRQKRPEEG